MTQSDHKPGAPRLAVVIPTRNAARTVASCVRAAAASPAVVDVVVVDRGSTDATREIATRAGARCIAAGPERSAQRNVGLEAITAPIVAFLDADQIVEPDVLAEACELVARGADAVILRERTIGRGFWAAGDPLSACGANAGSAAAADDRRRVPQGSRIHRRAPLRARATGVAKISREGSESFASSQ